MQDKRSPGKSGGHANLTSSRGSEGDNSNLECYRLRFLQFGGSSLISFGNASYLRQWVRMLLSIIDNEYICNIWYICYIIYVTWVHWSPAALPPTFCTRGPPESPFWIDKDKVTLWDKYQITTRALIQKYGKIQLTMNNELTLQDPRPPAVSMQTTPSPTMP